MEKLTALIGPYAIFSRGSSLAVYFILASFGLALIFPALSWTTFSEDDSHILRVSVEYGWLQHYLDSDVYQQLSVANYTPVILTIYKLLANTVGLNPLGFLIFSFTVMALFFSLAGVLLDRLCNDRWAGVFVMLIIFCNFSLHTLLTRPYTLHYIIGGVFALLAFLLNDSPATRRNTILCGGAMLAAMLAKEVYLILPVLIGCIALSRRRMEIVFVAFAALFLYLVMRFHVLGLPASVGRESDYYSGITGIDSATWGSFALYFVSSRLILLLFVFAALAANPIRAVHLLSLALLFGLPALAIPHGFTNPGLHGDRIFFALDSALAIAAVATFNGSSFYSKLRRWQFLIALFCIATVIHIGNSFAYRERVQPTADYLVTRYLVENGDNLDGMTVFVPLNFTQGELRRTRVFLEGNTYALTQDCLAAQQISTGLLHAFNDKGEKNSRRQLANTCQNGNATVTVVSPVQIRNGVISWKLVLDDGYRGGVLFIDRAVAVISPVFSAQMAIPRPGERYKFFANRQNEWWFSDAMPIETVELSGVNQSWRQAETLH